MTDTRCGYAVVDSDGIEQPCDRPATGWRWYQDVEHEDCLEAACDWHGNEGGRRIQQAEAESAARLDRQLEHQRRAMRAEAAIERARTIWRKHTGMPWASRNCVCVGCRMAAALDGTEDSDE